MRERRGEEVPMREIIYGSDAQFQSFKEELSDNLLHIYHNRILPPRCYWGDDSDGYWSDDQHRRTDIGFERDAVHGGVYILYINEGIKCAYSSEHPALRDLCRWFRDGRLIFLDYNDMKTFLRGLRWLYEVR